jgi:hypothetical protein
MKPNKEKVSAAANDVLKQLNVAKEAVVLILIGAGINDNGAKIIEQKFSSCMESVNNFLNIAAAEMRLAETKVE